MKKGVDSMTGSVNDASIMHSIMQRHCSGIESIQSGRLPITGDHS